MHKLHGIFNIVIFFLNYSLSIFFLSYLCHREIFHQKLLFVILCNKISSNQTVPSKNCFICWWSLCELCFLTLLIYQFYFFYEYFSLFFWVSICKLSLFFRLLVPVMKIYHFIRNIDTYVGKCFLNKIIILKSTG